MSVATGTYRWTEAYSVNIEILDKQHKGLLEAMNQLDQAMREGKGSAALDPLLDQLVRYALEHFAEEEALMEKHCYPGLATHRMQHDIFREKIGDFLEQHKDRKPGVPVKLMFYLQDWLKSHLLKSDKKYSVFLNARGVR